VVSGFADRAKDSAFQAEYEGSIPSTRSNVFNHLAKGIFLWWQLWWQLFYLKYCGGGGSPRCGRH
jgi:hypothetical protein